MIVINKVIVKKQKLPWREVLDSSKAAYFSIILI